MVLINGLQVPDAVGLSLVQYLDRAGHRRDRIALELNGEVVPAASYGEHVLAEGDRLEIVHFMGGG